MQTKLAYLFLLCTLILASCSKNDDEIFFEIPNEVQTQDFIWRGFNTWYFWKDEQSILNDSKLDNPEDYISFLKDYTNPVSLFETILHPDDRFSFYSQDYRALTNFLQGIRTDDGMVYRLYRLGFDNRIIVAVKYVIPNSSAAILGIKRGDLFGTVDGVVLDEGNYQNLLSSSKISLQLNGIRYENEQWIDEQESITLVKTEGLIENPVFKDSIYTINSQKIGYLVYNAFISNYEEELNQVFTEFKNNQVSSLILDLRYNSGGSTANAAILASMIYSNNTELLFAKQRWNSLWQGRFSDETLNENFRNQTLGGDNISSLGLSKIIIITESGTASASELLINGLSPYMDVVLVGDKTRGKNEFSLTLVDDPQSPDFPYLYRNTRESFINPDVQWGLQPIVGRFENSEGFSDFTEGFQPDIFYSEDPIYLGILGRIDEPLLARAIAQITGNSAAMKSSSKNFERIEFNAQGFLNLELR